MKRLVTSFCDFTEKPTFYEPLEGGSSEEVSLISFSWWFQQQSYLTCAEGLVQLDSQTLAGRGGRDGKLLFFGNVRTSHYKTTQTARQRVVLESAGDNACRIQAASPSLFLSRTESFLPCSSS